MLWESHPPPTPWRGFAVVAALGTALRLALIWSGWVDNLVLADDAFYYFTIARNIAAGHGATFDGLAPTNGFHPLWLLVITPIYTLAGALHASPWLGIRLSLSLCALFDLVSGWLLYRLLVRFGHPRGAIWASGLWLLFPGSVLATLRGLEGSLNALLFILHA